MEYCRIKILIILLAILSGCTNQDDSQSITPPSNTIRIGVILPFSGDCGSFGTPELQAIQLAVNEINDAGGIFEKNIELVVRDSRTDPRYAENIALDIVYNEGVIAILGEDASGVTEAIRQTIRGANIPIISGASSSYTLTTNDAERVFFRTVPSTNYEGTSMANKIASLGDSVARVLYVDDEYGNALLNTFRTRFLALGKTIEKSVPFKQNETSYSAEIESLFAGITSDTSSRRFVLIAYPRCGAQIIRDWKASGYEAKWFLSSGMKAKEFIDMAGATNVEGFYGIAPYWGATNVRYEYFRDAYEEFVGRDPRMYRCTENWYDAMILLGYAILKADTLNPRAIADSLRSVSAPPGSTVVVGEFRKGKRILTTGTTIDTTFIRNDINYEGASGSVDLDNNGDVVGAYELWKIENGVFVHIEQIP